MSTALRRCLLILTPFSTQSPHFSQPNSYPYPLPSVVPSPGDTQQSLPSSLNFLRSFPFSQVSEKGSHGHRAAAAPIATPPSQNSFFSQLKSATGDSSAFEQQFLYSNSAKFHTPNMPAAASPASSSAFSQPRPTDYSPSPTYKRRSQNNAAEMPGNSSGNSVVPIDLFQNSSTLSTNLAHPFVNHYAEALGATTRLDEKTALNFHSNHSAVSADSLPGESDHRSEVKRKKHRQIDERRRRRHATRFQELDQLCHELAVQYRLSPSSVSQESSDGNGNKKTKRSKDVILLETIRLLRLMRTLRP